MQLWSHPANGPRTSGRAGCQSRIRKLRKAEISQANMPLIINEDVGLSISMYSISDYRPCVNEVTHTPQVAVYDVL